MTKGSAWPTEIRWFDAVGTCRCGKPAHGILRGPANASYGAACAPCARKALDAAEKARWLADLCKGHLG
jgi:hypothetical protein